MFVASTVTPTKNSGVSSVRGARRIGKYCECLHNLGELGKERKEKKEYHVLNSPKEFRGPTR